MNKWLIKYCILRLEINPNITKEEKYNNNTTIFQDDYFIFETNDNTIDTPKLVNHKAIQKLNNILMDQVFYEQDIYDDFIYCNDDITNNLVIKIKNNSSYYIYKYSFEIIEMK